MGVSFIGVAVLALGSWRTDDPRGALEAVLASMEAAVLAGDQAAYIAHVDGADPIFRKEQENWAADLARHLPVEFDLSLGEEITALEGGGFLTVLTTTWKLEGWERARKVDFPARFVEGGEGSARAWRYAGEAWEVLDGERVRVFFPKGREELAGRVAEAFPEVRAHVEEGFEISVDRVQEVKLYPTMRHLQHSIYLSYTDGLGGWNEPGESVKLLAGGLNERGLKVLLAHEFGHVATFEMGEAANKMPWWILEGSAELASERFGRGREGVDRRVRGWAKASGLAAWEDIADFHDFPPELMGHVYTQGHHMMGYISDTYGRTKRNAWLRALSTGSTIDGASKAALGLPWEELDRRWRESLVAGGVEEGN